MTNDYLLKKSNCMMYMPRTRSNARNLVWQAFNVVTQWMRNTRHETRAILQDVRETIAHNIYRLNLMQNWLFAENQRLVNMIGVRSARLDIFRRRQDRYDALEERNNALQWDYDYYEDQLADVSLERESRMAVLTALASRPPRPNR